MRSDEASGAPASASVDRAPIAATSTPPPHVRLAQRPGPHPGAVSPIQGYSGVALKRSRARYQAGFFSPS
jgi:hypothetical protein